MPGHKCRPRAFLFPLLGLLIARPVPAAGRIIDPGPAVGHAAPTPASRDHPKLDRILRLIENSNVPDLVGRRRWGELAAAHRPRIEQARTPAEFAAAVNDLIHAAGISHFHYFTDDDWLYWHLLSAFGGGPDAEIEHVGVVPEQVGGRWFVRGVLEGSPASDSPLRVGDELLAVDDRPFAPIDSFRGRGGTPVRLRLRRKPWLAYSFYITPVKESLHAAVQRAIRCSIRVISQDGYRLAYLHAWSLLGDGGEYRRLLDMQDRVDGLLLDYRDGVGGRAELASRFMFGTATPAAPYAAGDFWRKPAVMLIADGTRSAKEIVAQRVKRHGRAALVGTPSMGHVATLAALRRVGADGLLMLPGHRLPQEGRPVEPHIHIHRDIRYAAGVDLQLQCARELLVELINLHRAGAAQPNNAAPPGPSRGPVPAPRDGSAPEHVSLTSRVHHRTWSEHRAPAW